MKKTWKTLIIVLLAVFLVWNAFVFFVAFSGCPPAYDVITLTYVPETPGNGTAIIHVTDQDLLSHPYLKEAFENGKRIILPVYAIPDIIPGNCFGPEYAVHRMPFWERDKFIECYRQDSKWEYHGTWYRFIALTC
jgi:hypothetical protein